MLNKYAPLIPTHPAIRNGETCPACKKTFQVGDTTTLITLGPGDNPISQENARKGNAYNAVCVLVHWACATGEVEKEEVK